MEIQKLKHFNAPHLRQEVLRHLPVVDDPQRPSGLFLNMPALEALKSASTDRCFFLMIDVIYIKTPVAAHIVLILATMEDGSLKKVVYTKTTVRCSGGAGVPAGSPQRDQSIEDHLLAIVADEGPNNALLVEAGYPVLVDLRHLINGMGTDMGYAEVVLQAVHRHAVFRNNNGADKFATIRAMTGSIPAATRTRILFEIKVWNRRFAVLDSPFHLRECNNDVLESLGRKLATEASLAMEEAFTAVPSMKARLLKVHQLLRRVVCLLSMLEKLDLDLSGLAE